MKKRGRKRKKKEAKMQRLLLRQLLGKKDEELLHCFSQEGEESSDPVLPATTVYLEYDPQDLLFPQVEELTPARFEAEREKGEAQDPSSLFPTLAVSLRHLQEEKFYCGDFYKRQAFTFPIPPQKGCYYCFFPYRKEEAPPATRLCELIQEFCILAPHGKYYYGLIKGVVSAIIPTHWLFQNEEECYAFLIPLAAHYPQKVKKFYNGNMPPALDFLRYENTTP
jgi:hypothetical protein